MSFIAFFLLLFYSYLVAIAFIVSVKQAHTKRRADRQTDMAKSLLMLLQNLHSFIRKCLLLSGTHIARSNKHNRL